MVRSWTMTIFSQEVYRRQREHIKSNKNMPGRGSIVIRYYYLKNGYFYSSFLSSAPCLSAFLIPHNDVVLLSMKSISFCSCLLPAWFPTVQLVDLYPFLSFVQPQSTKVLELLMLLVLCSTHVFVSLGDVYFDCFILFVFFLTLGQRSRRGA
ncbi:MAG: hypothetical protein JOS17DRAFT_275091 [Linnemannia elongata]|nr:MAG: hypothetical protein JOS17DRAFT_275091 [Linnemannia elongata]